MEMVLDSLLDALLDAAKLSPFLLVTIFVMEFIEHRAADKFAAALQRAGRFGAPLGALLGIVPQCGFSAACAHLYNGGLVTAGTVAAVFLSTSDEALPILLSNRAGLSSVWRLIAVKLIVAVVAGVALDLLWPLSKQRVAFEESEQPHECECDSHSGFFGILWAAVKRTLSILLFILLVTFALNLLIAFIGETRLAALLLPGPLQPLLAAVVGLIPNCAASVMLTQLYLDGMITFGSAVAGLCSAAGIGMLVLLRGKRGKRSYAVILGTVFFAAVLTGSLLQLIG